MKFNDEDFLLLQTIHKLSVLGHPCPGDTVAKAASFMHAGIVANKGEVVKNGMADLHIPDEEKWKLLASGRIFQN